MLECEPVRRALPFLVALIVGLALVTWAGALVVHRTTRSWFERDLNLRAKLAVSGARQALLARWSRESAEELRQLLQELTHDERIMAAAACNAEFEVLARTREFPDSISFHALEPHVRVDSEASGPTWTSWGDAVSLPGGSVHVAAIPVGDGEATRGCVVLVHDLSFIERREAQVRRLLFTAFGFLSLAASAVTIIAARLSRREWMSEIRKFLRGGSSRPEFQPLLRDVRELVDRIVAEKDSDREGGAWTPQRLKQTLNRHLHGEKVVILANREPYIHERSKEGSGVHVIHPASGLVTALEPVMRACSGTWVAHGSGSADRETADRHGRVRVPPGEESYLIRRVWLSREEETGYYYGFSNEGLWPLCHIAHTRPLFRGDDWNHYQAVNRKFVEAVCAEVDSEDPIVLVQDYHFALAPRMIRERLPRATVIMFWHIPWANSQHFGICPWRKELLEGILGASIVGFHTQFDCNNFVDSVDRFLEARIDREQAAVVQQGRSTLVRPYPISLEWPSRWLASAPSIGECRAGVELELGLRPNTLLGLGVDRLDYTKGIEERFLAVERLLDRFPRLPRTIHVRAARCAESHRHRGLPAAQRERRVAGEAHQRAIRHIGLQAHRPLAFAPRASGHLPLLPCRRPLLREQPPRRHESRREGVRVGARRRGRGSRPEPVHRRRPRAHGGLDREPVRPRGGELGPRGGLAHVRGGATRPDALDAELPQGVQRPSLGRQDARRCGEAAESRSTHGALDGPREGSRGVGRMKNILSRGGREILEEFAWSNVLLGFDFDGTLAPIVDVPARACMRRITRERLSILASLCKVVVISGRAHADVLERLDGIRVAGVIGNHGMEPWDEGSIEISEVRGWVTLLRKRTAALDGVEVEDKGCSLAVHYRRSRSKKKARAVILRTVSDLEGARVIGGKQVVNLLPAGAPHKGLALERERSRLRCDTAVYVGDDETDEDVFDLALPGRLLTIRVGRKLLSAADYCIPNQAAIDRFLTALIEFRRDYERRKQAV